MQLWIILVIIYGILKGLREPVKKKILKDIDVINSLFAYTFVGFLMSALTCRDALNIDLYMFLMIILKSAVIFVAWIMSFVAIKKVPVSVYGVCDMSRVIFSTLLGVLVIGETLTLTTIFGLILVIAGLYIANKKTNTLNEEYKLRYVWVIFISCFLNAISGTLDKIIMSTHKISSSSLQFWFMLILSVFYLLYMIIKREKIEIKKSFTNPYIYILSISLILGDRLLFMANADPCSKVTIMTLVKQSSAIVTILLGYLLYKEKNILKKLICALIILLGIMMAIFG